MNFLRQLKNNFFLCVLVATLIISFYVVLGFAFGATVLMTTLGISVGGLLLGGMMFGILNDIDR